MLDFRRDYAENTSLEQIMPALVASYPERYAGMGLHDLGDQMFAQLKKSSQTKHLQNAYSQLPEMRMTPAEAYQLLVRGEAERVAIDDAAGRMVATSVVPYPPGIPMLMPGEVLGAANGPYIGYLKALQVWDRELPGFGHDTHGVEVEDGEYYLQCFK